MREGNANFRFKAIFYLKYTSNNIINVRMYDMYIYEPSRKLNKHEP